MDRQNAAQRPALVVPAALSRQEKLLKGHHGFSGQSRLGYHFGQQIWEHVFTQPSVLEKHHF